jgi:hypothetical protein
MRTPPSSLFRLTAIVVLLLAGLVGHMGIARAATLVVTSNADSGGGSLRDTISAAAAGDTITFAAALQNATIALTTATLSIGKNLTIDGTGKNITISGGTTFTVLTVSSGVSLNLNGLTISNGHGAQGGGIFNNGGALSIANSTFSSNTVSGGTGGGIFNNGGTVRISNSTFSGNTAGQGGGIYNNSGTVNITNSTFSTNSATSTGGAIFNNNGTVSIANSTLSANSATQGGGIYNLKTLQLGGTILAGNTASGGGPDCFIASGALTSNGYNLIGNNSNCSFTAATGDQVGTAGSPINPSLSALASNGGPTQTMALQSGSRAISQIPSASCPGIDQRGFTRKSLGTSANCDIGAYESSSPGADTTKPTCTLAGVDNSTSPATLDITVQDAIAGLQSVVVINPVNATVNVPAFTLGTTSAQMVTAHRTVAAQPGSFGLQITDLAGNVTICDPVLVELSAADQLQVAVVHGLAASDHVLHLYNGTPGLRAVLVLVNNRWLRRLAPLPGQQVTLDIGPAMQAGDQNTVLLLGLRNRSAGATIVFDNV